MRKIILRLVFFWAFTAIIIDSTNANAKFEKFRGFQKGMQSADLLLGQPTLIRYNYFHDWKRSVSFDLGYHFDEWYYLGANYNFYFYNIRDRLKRDANFFNSLLFYLSPGIFLGPEPDANKKDDKLKIGAKVGLGTEYLFNNTNFSLKVEIAPALFLKAEDDFGFQGMVGMAYYFGFPKQKIIKKAAPLRVKRPSKESVDIDKVFEEFD